MEIAASTKWETHLKNFKLGFCSYEGVKAAESLLPWELGGIAVFECGYFLAVIHMRVRSASLGFRRNLLRGCDPVAWLQITLCQ